MSNVTTWYVCFPKPGHICIYITTLSIHVGITGLTTIKMSLA